MAWNNVKKMAALTAAAAWMTAGQAFAADVTDVLDAADEVYLGKEKVSDPFDISLTPKFIQKYEWAKLKREYNDKGNVRLLNELEYERVVNEFDIDLEIGMFHDFSFRMNLPIIISDQQSYQFDTSSDDPKYHISPANSTLAPAQTSASRPYKFFELESGQNLKGKERSGLGDMSFGIAWSPYNTERHFIPERPWERNTGRSTITLAFDYVAPTGDAKTIDNTGAGSGVHELIFSVAASHRFPYVDPYVRLQYGLPIGDDDTYKDYGHNQSRVDPGMWGRIDLGIEFIPYESIDTKFQRFVKLDLRGYFKYTSEGRVYSELGDAFATGSCYNIASGDLRPECAWVKSKWSNAIDANDYHDMGSYKGQWKEDGIFDYEGFATIGGAVNLVVQPVQYVQIVAGFAMDYSQNHFVTFTKIGRDRVSYDEGNITPGKDGVVTENLVEERNPTFSTALDKVGNRIKRTESMNLEWFVGLKLMY